MVFDIILYLFVTLILVALAIIYLKLIGPEKSLYNALRAQGVPGEPFVPILGQLREIHRHREADISMVYHEELALKHGHLFLFGYGPITRLVVNEPDMLADVFGRANAQNYIKPKDFTTVFAPIIGYHNLLVAEGSEHERARKMLNPAFHYVNLQSMVSIITDRTSRALETLLSSNVEAQPVDLQIQLNTLTLSIIASSAFGSGFETIADAKDIICRVLSEVLEATEYRSMRMINQIPFLARLPFWRRHIVDDGARKIADFVDQIITDRRQGRSNSMCAGDDILDLLLSAVDAEGRSFTDQEVREEALAFVTAGSETTGNLVTWILYVLMTHEDVLTACREEVDRVLPDGAEPTHEHLPALVVCEAIINETLRLYPPAPFFSRCCTHEHNIGSKRQLRIPVGTNILVNTHLLHRRSDFWPRPLEFDYTRWMRDPKTGLKPKLPHPFAYLPFAAGSRNCIGQNFALLEAKIMLAMLVKHCSFSLVPGQKVVPDIKITMRPKYGLWAKINKRQI